MKKTKIYKKLQRAFFVWVWRNLPPCREFVPMISESLDRKLPFHKRLLIKIHLLACKPCVRFLEQSKFLREAMHELDAELIQKETPAKLSDEARDRLKNILKTTASVYGLFFIF